MEVISCSAACLLVALLLAGLWALHWPLEGTGIMSGADPLGYCLCNECYPGELYLRDFKALRVRKNKTYRHAAVPGATTIFGQDHFFLAHDDSWTEFPTYQEVCGMLRVPVKGEMQCGGRKQWP